ncbi:hypothetical protein [Aquimarina sp. 2304DJ70-9]|uniref:hypothetical protein n=1 Tax=Aquimarina penaris TaxID=3231044 RepID=UPI0034617E9A
MRKTLTAIILLIFSFTSFSQEKIIVNTEIIDLSSLIGDKQYSEYITDLKKVPENIRFNLDNYLKIILDELYANALFKDGYVSDLAGYFKENPNAFDRGWIITKYQFVFKLVKPDIGIINYPLKVDMDEYGQIIDCNWPRKWFGKVNDFVERTEIEKKAMKWAEKKTLNSTDYDVDLIYDKGNNTMSWKFQFPKKHPNVSRSYQVLEIDWSNNKILKEYNIYTSISH